MTRYLVLWDHWSGKSAAVQVREDLKSGVFQDFGIFATTGRGYVIVSARDEVELLKIINRYREFGVRCTSAEPALSLDEYLKALPS